MGGYCYLNNAAIAAQAFLDQGHEKVAIIDVRSGQWETFAPPPVESAATNADNSRVSSDQSQVAALKEAGYKAAVDEIARRYGS